MPGRLPRRASDAPFHSQVLQPVCLCDAVSMAEQRVAATEPCPRASIDCRLSRAESDLLGGVRSRAAPMAGIVVPDP